MKTVFLFMALLTFSGPLSPALMAEEDEVTAEAAKTPSHITTTRPLPFRSVVHSIDEEHRAYFRMGKHRLRKLHVTPTTRFLLASGEPATAEALRVGIDIRGSYRQREDGDYDAITVKIGAKERNQ